LVKRFTALATAALVGGSLAVFSLAYAVEHAIRFELEVLPEAKRYVELLKYPPYLVIALQNNGFSPVRTGRIFIEDDHTVRVHIAVLSFVGVKQSLYRYKAVVEWSLGVAQTTFEMPVEVDVSRIGEGTAIIRVYAPLAGFASEDLTRRIQAKLQDVANVRVQQRMLAYFDRIAGSGSDRVALEKIFLKVLIDAYNLPVVAPGLAGAREPGDAVALSDQWMFFATLVIWGVLVPTYFGIRLWWRRRVQREGAPR
jgi:hypothetical protein